MTPDTGPDEGANQNDEYLGNAPPYSFSDPNSDEDDADSDYVGNDDDGSDNGDTMGYQLLNQEVPEVDTVCSTINQLNPTDDVNQPSQVYNNTSETSLNFPLSSLLLPISNNETLQESGPTFRQDIELDQDKINEIKKAMSGFELPSSSFPDWASMISEDQLANFVHCRTKST